jgi:hypothetical protein
MESACAGSRGGLGFASGRRRWGRAPATARNAGRALCVVSGGIAVIFLAGCDQLLMYDRTSRSTTGQQPGQQHSTAARSVPSSTPVWSNAPVSSDARVANGSDARVANGGAKPVVVKSGETPAVNLVGLDERQVEAMLGPPTEQEDRPPAKTWRYRGERCTVDLALYPDVETRVFRTLSYEVVTGEDTAAQERRCLAELRSHAHPR